MKKIPMRQCIGCREMKPKKELVRIVCTKDGDISVDLTGKKNGRGAYLCHSDDCLKKVVKSRALDRIFAAKVGQEVYDTLSFKQETDDIFDG